MVTIKHRERKFSMLLAIDTATRYMSLALHDGQTLIGEQTWRTANRHNALLAPSLAQMLDICDVKMDDLSVIAVTHGPGSYTGLRIGVSFAKGIAAVKQLPLIGISTLDMIAVGQPVQSTRYKLLVVIQAGRGRIIAAQYRVKKGRWSADNEAEITAWEDLLEGLDGSYYVSGEIDQKGRVAIEAARENEASLTIVDAAYRLRRGGFLAQEAWRRYENGSPEDFLPTKLVPIYMSSPG